MLQKLLGFDPKQHNLKTEIMAGVTTFLTMAYILAVNPNIFSALASQGMDTHAVFTSTALAAIVGTLVMAFYAKKPFGLAPGMGLNAFFVFTVCLTMGYSWQFALTAILIEGILFILMTVTKIRTLIVDAIPATLKRAIGAGIIATALIGMPMGLTSFHGMVDVPPSVAPIFCQFEFHNILSIDMVIVVLTFLFIVMFDTMGTLVGVCTKAGMMRPNGTIPGLNKAFMADAVATVTGACLGASTTTTYVESAAGVAQGGRTGLTALSTALCFVVALFFAPLFLAIPSAATAPVLIIVGLFMLSPIKDIELNDYAESIPAFITIIMMPLTYSISDGILCGVIAYVAINVLCGNWKRLNATLYVLAILFVMKYIFI